MQQGAPDAILAILIIQLGLVHPDQLLEAMTDDSSQDKEGLCERLVSLGHMQEKDRAMVEAMALEALGIHHGDVAETMDALGGMDTLSLGGESGAAAGDISVTAEHAGRYQPRVGGRKGGEIGRGGMGRVLAVFDDHLEREVAVKELLTDGAGIGTPGESTTPIHISRFIREARLTGQLAHPNIVPVYELGKKQDGTLYYTMKLVQGTDMAQRLAECQTPEQRQRLLPQYLDLCQAIAYAHSRGVVHRDIKPHNVMLGEFGETVVLDWGLAKARGTADPSCDAAGRPLTSRDSSSQKTAFGTRLGTPVYMSPEQARGDIDIVDEQSDVWSLGVVLYEILVGRRPFFGESPAELVSAICSGACTPPLQVDDGLPPELASICGRAMQVDRKLRYESAGPLATDVESYLTGGHVAAYEYSSLELLNKFLSKNKLASALSAGLVVVLAVAAFVTYGAYRKADANFQQATTAKEAEVRQRLTAENNERVAHENLSRGYLEKAERLLDDKEYFNARIFAAASLLHNPHNALSPHFDEQFARDRDDVASIALADSACYLAEVNNILSPHVALKGHERFVRSMAFSPDGKLLATGSADKTIRLWDVGTGKQIRILTGHSANILTLKFTPDGQVASGSADGSIRLWNKLDSKSIGRVDTDLGMVMSLDISADGQQLAAAGYKDRILMYSLPGLVETGRLEEHTDKVLALAYSRDGRFLATASNDMTVRIWDPVSGRPVSRLDGFSEVVRAVAFSATGRYLVAGTLRQVRVFSVPGLTEITSWEGHRSLVWNLSFTPSDGMMASGGYAGDKIKLWTFPEGELLLSISGQDVGLQLVRFSPDGHVLATGAGGPVVRLWNVADTPGVASLEGHDSTVYGVAYSPDGGLLASAGVDKTVGLFDTGTGDLLASMKGHTGLVFGLSFSSDGRYLASTGSDGVVIVWDPESRQMVTALSEHPGGAMTVAFSPDAKYLASASLDGRVVLRRTADWVPVSRFNADNSQVRTMKFSPDGTMLATPCRDGKVRLFSIPDGEELFQLEGHMGIVAWAEFSPDGKLLVTSGADREVRLWDVEKRAPLAVLKGHTGPVWWATFSTDGNFLASGGYANAIRIWDVHTHKLQMLLRTTGTTGYGDFSPNGRTLAVPDGKKIKLYPLTLPRSIGDPDDLIEQAKSDAGVQLNGFNVVPE